MFKCYQCKKKVKELERNFEDMNLCIACAQKDSDSRKPATGFVWSQPPQYVLDMMAADTDKSLSKEMYGY